MNLIILDRDGVINEDSDDYIKSPDELIPIRGSLSAIARLNQADYTVVVATNQSGIARGYYDWNTLNLMHDKLGTLLAAVGGRIDRYFICPHGPDDHCDCRKPKSGLFEQIKDYYQTNLNGVYAIGDSLRDLQAATTAGAAPMLVKTGKGVRTLAKLNETWRKLPIYANLADAVDTILKPS